MGMLLALIYVCFVSLGLPDSLLGSAWPIMHTEICVPMSYAGIVSMVISVGTIVSSLMCDKITHKIGSGRLTAVSIFLTAVALFGFSMSNRFWMLVLWAVPYGLGAGGVDAVLNNYVALHYKSQHMSWLHCMWGVGAAISPYIMSFSLIKLDGWSYGYLIVAVIQIILSAFVFISLPIWKKGSEEEKATDTEYKSAPIKLRELIKLPGAVPCLFTFFGYCSLEITSSLWTSTYLVQNRGMDAEAAAGFASTFYLGITLGRAINGFLAMKFGDRFLIRLGIAVVLVGTVCIFIPFHTAFALVGFVIAGLGCAPIYPCIIHMTPDIFGKDKSQAMIGIQMAFAYLGFCIMPPILGFIVDMTTVALLPVFILLLLALTAVMHEALVYKTKKHSKIR